MIDDDQPAVPAGELPLTPENLDAELRRLAETAPSRQEAKRQMLDTQGRADLDPQAWDAALLRLDE